MQLGKAFSLLLKQDLKMAWRQRSDCLEPLLFFILIISLFPLALSSDPKLLQTMAPAVIWVAVLLASLLGLGQLFREDFNDGSLEQLALSPRPLPVLLLAKITAHWLVSSMPFLLCAPLAGFLLHLSSLATNALILSLLLATPTLSLIGAIGVGVTLGLRNSGLLLPLLVLPLYTPVLIFAASMVTLASQGLPVIGNIAWLGVFLILALTLAPIAISAAVRIGMS